MAVQGASGGAGRTGRRGSTAALGTRWAKTLAVGLMALVLAPASGAALQVAAACPSSAVLPALCNPGFESADLGWTFDGQPQYGTNMAIRDTAVAHTGSASARLTLRWGGGEVDQRVAIPEHLRGTNVSLGFWALMPHAGSSSNKWLTGILGILGPDGRTLGEVSWSQFDALPGWTRIQTEPLSMAKDAAQIRVAFHTRNGNGAYSGYDRNAWIDDVALSFPDADLLVTMAALHRETQGVLTQVIKDDGGDTRALVDQRSDDIVRLLGDGFSRTLAAIADLKEVVVTGFADVLGAVEEVRLSVERGFAETLRTMKTRFDGVDGRLQHLQDTVDEVRDTDPLSVSIAGAPGPQGAAGPFFVTVLQRGQMVGADLTVLVDGAVAESATVDTAGTAGLYKVTLGDGRLAAGSHALTVVAQADRHHGAATTWYGLGLLPPGTEAEVEAAAEEAAERVEEAKAGVEAALDPLIGEPAASEPVEVELLAVREEVPPQQVATPGVALDVASLQGQGNAGGDFVLAWDLLGRASGSVALPGLGALPPLELSLVAVPPAEAWTPGLRAEAVVSYRYDAGAIRCALPTDAGCPTIPGPVSGSWLTGPGWTSALRIELRLVGGDGQVLAEQAHEVPLAGQALGWGAGALPGR